MRLGSKVAVIAFLTLWGTMARAQLKDMPSQAEFDPILENAENKLKGFVATLTEFRAEAAALNEQMLTDDLESIRELQQAIQMTRSTGNGGANKGLNMQRLVLVLGGFDDATLEAATWKSLAELRVCEQMIQHESPSRYEQFGTRLAMDLQLLREVGRQLFHPTLRMARATDEILLMALSDSESKSKPK
jgi:hypothetical protein